jgi:hypothetical protein
MLLSRLCDLEEGGSHPGGAEEKKRTPKTFSKQQALLPHPEKLSLRSSRSLWFLLGSLV